MSDWDAARVVEREAWVAYMAAPLRSGERYRLWLAFEAAGAALDALDHLATAEPRSPLGRS